MTDDGEYRLPSDTTSQPSPEQLYALVDSNLEISFPLPQEITTNHVLRCPTSSELIRIRDAIEKWDGPTGLVILSYESTLEPSSMGGFSSRRSTNPADWRYWVVAVAASHIGSLNSGLIDIERVARLTNVELRFGHCFAEVQNPFGTFWPGIRGSDYPFDRMRPQRLGLADLEEIRRLSSLLPKIAQSHPEIERAINTFYRVRRIPKHEPLYVLALFAVMESLLTHDPEGGYDSLGHQIKTKIQLLDKRFMSPLD